MTSKSSMPNGTRFGSLTVVGNNGLTGSDKRYYVECDVCSKDKELFPFIQSTKSSLTKGIKPCGCSPSPKWNEDQTIIRLKRKLKSIGLDFVGLPNGFDKGKESICSYSCSKHGERRTSIGNAISQLKGCKICISTSASYPSRYTSPDELIRKFNKIHDGAYDYSIESSKRYKDKISITCKEHGEFTQSVAAHMAGKGCPLCKMKNFKYCYVNSVKDNDILVAIKFGVAKNIKNRIKYQRSSCKFSIDNMFAYKMPSYESCVQAENEVKKKLKCGVVDKSDMKDGFTETTSPENARIIIGIFEKYGGIQM